MDKLILEDRFVPEILNMEEFEKEAIKELHIDWTKKFTNIRVANFELQFITKYEKSVLAKLTDLSTQLFYHIVYTIRS